MTRTPVRRQVMVIAVTACALTLPLVVPASAADKAGPWKRGKAQPVAAQQATPLATAVVTPPEAPRSTGLRVPASVPSSIAADCSTDVSAAMNSWLDSLPSTGVDVIFPAGACFRTERTVSVRGKTNWVLDGNGTELRRTQTTPAELRYPNNNRHLAVVDSQDITLREFRVTGLNTVSDVPNYPTYGRYVRDLEFEHAYSAWNSKRLVLTDLFADAPFGDGIYLHSNSSDVTVRNVDLARNGRQGIGVLASRVLIDGANLRSSRRSGVDLEPDNAAGTMGDIEVRNSTISSHLLAIASGGPGNVNRIHVHHNTIRRTGVPWLYAARAGFERNDWTVTDNWVQPELGSPAAAMRFGNAKRALVTRNVVPVASTQSRLAFDLAESSEITATCNNFRNAVPGLSYSKDGTGTVTSSMNTTTKQPPSCLDRDQVGAPRAVEPVRSSNDFFTSSTKIQPLTVGQRMSFTVNNTAAGAEEFEPRTYGSTGRTVWFSYRTGATVETIALRTTGALRSVYLLTGDSLYWHERVWDWYDTGALDLDLQPQTTYHFQLDDSTYFQGDRTTARSASFTRTR